MSRTAVLTPDQVKENFRRAGQTITQWAKQHGYSRVLVYRVLNGQAKAYFGLGHEIAVKLGLKPVADSTPSSPSVQIGRRAA